MEFETDKRLSCIDMQTFSNIIVSIAFWILIKDTVYLMKILIAYGIACYIVAFALYKY